MSIEQILLVEIEESNYGLAEKMMIPLTKEILEKGLN